MNLYKWAQKWGVSMGALYDLERLMGRYTQAGRPIPVLSEAAVSAEVRLEAAEKGGVLWRNNVGAAQDAKGNFVRYGLCNDSKALNARVKSSDLVGLRPVLVTPNDVGCVIGQFVCREVKRSAWVYTGTAREQAQLKFIELVLSMGGDAAFANRRGTL